MLHKEKCPEISQCGIESISVTDQKPHPSMFPCTSECFLNRMLVGGPSDIFESMFLECMSPNGGAKVGPWKVQTNSADNYLGAVNFIHKIHFWYLLDRHWPQMCRGKWDDGVLVDGCFQSHIMRSQGTFRCNTVIQHIRVGVFRIFHSFKNSDYFK